jgi:hypothetical protein
MDASIIDIDSYNCEENLKDGKYHDENTSNNKAIFFIFYLPSLVLLSVGYILDVDKRTPESTISSTPARNLKGTNFFTNI